MVEQILTSVIAAEINVQAFEAYACLHGLQLTAM